MVRAYLVYSVLAVAWNVAGLAFDWPYRDHPMLDVVTVPFNIGCLVLAVWLLRQERARKRRTQP